MRARLKRWFATLIVACGVGYPLALLCVIGSLWFVGERWWVTGFALYLPRVLFAVPLPLLVLALALLRRKRLMRLQVVSLLLVLFPLMGLSVAWPRHVSDTTPKLRILQYNVNSCYGGADQVAAEILAQAPDVAFVQELPSWRRAELQTALAEHYPHVYGISEFMVASAYPIVSVEEARELEYEKKLLPARLVKYVIDTSLGRVAFFSLHPISPRSDFRHTRAGGLSKEIKSGRLFERALHVDMQRTSRLRALQIHAAVAWARAESKPAVLLGDTNVPHLSAVRHDLLSAFYDGFSQVGFGFGNTFPARFPWMRLDLILASEQLRFLSFDVGTSQASDHRCVVADVARALP